MVDAVSRAIFIWKNDVGRKRSRHVTVIKCKGRCRLKRQHRTQTWEKSSRVIDFISRPMDVRDNRPSELVNILI